MVRLPNHCYSGKQSINQPTLIYVYAISLLPFGNVYDAYGSTLLFVPVEAASAACKQSPTVSQLRTAAQSGLLPRRALMTSRLNYSFGLPNRDNLSFEQAGTASHLSRVTYVAIAFGSSVADDVAHATGSRP